MIAYICEYRDAVSFIRRLLFGHSFAPLHNLKGDIVVQTGRRLYRFLVLLRAWPEGYLLSVDLATIVHAPAITS